MAATYMSEGRRIQIFRLMKGWARDELAAEAGLDPNYLARVEKDLIIPPEKILARIVRSLEISVEEFYNTELSDILDEDQSPVSDADIQRIIEILKHMTRAELSYIHNMIISMIGFRNVRSLDTDEDKADE